MKPVVSRRLWRGIAIGLAGTAFLLTLGLIVLAGVGAGL